MRILTEQQSLQQIDSEQVFAAWIDNRRRILAHRYGMRWVRAGGREYLLRLTDARGNGRSLGPRSEKTQSIFDEFQSAKARAGETGKRLRERLDLQVRLNRALRLGRAPAIVGEILREVDLVSPETFTVVGTHALFGFEAMAGVHMTTELLASGDVDLLTDGRRKLSILASSLEPDGLIGLLRRVDKSFDLVADGAYRARNAGGFLVDFLTQPRDMRETTPIRAQAGDLVAAEVEGLQWLANAPHVRVTAIAGDGVPFRMRVPDPRVFCLHKAWLSQRVDREPVKKGRDIAQARMLADVIRERLPHYPLDDAFFAAVPGPLRQAFGLIARAAAGIASPPGRGG